MKYAMEKKLQELKKHKQHKQFLKIGGPRPKLSKPK